jgi:hypothetical protein
LLLNKDVAFINEAYTFSHYFIRSVYHLRVQEMAAAESVKGLLNVKGRNMYIFLFFLTFAVQDFESAKVSKAGNLDSSEFEMVSDSLIMSVNNTAFFYHYFEKKSSFHDTVNNGSSRLRSVVRYYPVKFENFRGFVELPLDSGRFFVRFYSFKNRHTYLEEMQVLKQKPVSNPNIFYGFSGSNYSSLISTLERSHGKAKTVKGKVAKSLDQWETTNFYLLATLSDKFISVFYIFGSP